MIPILEHTKVTREGVQLEVARGRKKERLRGDSLITAGFDIRKAMATWELTRKDARRLQRKLGGGSVYHSTNAFVEARLRQCWDEMLLRALMKLELGDIRRKGISIYRWQVYLTFTRA
jgi:hypothetical protein